MYDLATVVPAMEPFYNQASDSYEQACVRYVNTLINYVRTSPPSLDDLALYLPSEIELWN